MGFFNWWRKFIGGTNGAGSNDEEPAGRRIMSTYELYEDIQLLWPYMIMNEAGGNLWMGDMEYYLPSMKELREFLAQDATNHLSYIAKIFDCNRFAVMLAAQCGVYVAEKVLAGELKKEDTRPWALAEVWGTLWNGKKQAHAVNICRTRDQGWVGIEPQDDTPWSLTYETDRGYFVKM